MTCVISSFCSIIYNIDIVGHYCVSILLCTPIFGSIWTLFSQHKKTDKHFFSLPFCTRKILSKQTIFTCLILSFFFLSSNRQRIKRRIRQFSFSSSVHSLLLEVNSFLYKQRSPSLSLDPFKLYWQKCPCRLHL